VGQVLVFFHDAGEENIFIVLFCNADSAQF